MPEAYPAFAAPPSPRCAGRRRHVGLLSPRSRPVMSPAAVRSWPVSRTEARSSAVVGSWPRPGSRHRSTSWCSRTSRGLVCPSVPRRTIKKMHRPYLTPHDEEFWPVRRRAKINVAIRQGLRGVLSAFCISLAGGMPAWADVDPGAILDLGHCPSLKIGGVTLDSRQQVVADYLMRGR
jgi:hypothetical protein